MVSSIVLPILSLSSPNLSLKGKADFLSHSSSHLDLGSGSYLSPGKTKIRTIKDTKKMPVVCLESLSSPPALHTRAVQVYRAKWKLPQCWINSITARHSMECPSLSGRDDDSKTFVYDNGTISTHSTSGHCWALLGKHQRHTQPWLQKQLNRKGLWHSWNSHLVQDILFHSWPSCVLTGKSLGVLYTDINTQKHSTKILKVCL